MAHRRGLAHLALAVTLVLWASAFVGIRYLAPHFTPGALSLGRLLVGSVVLLVAILVSRSWVSPTPRQWLGLVAIGVLWFGVYNVALNAGEQLIDAATSAMLIQISPVLIALLSVIALGERLSGWLMLGMAVAFAGVIVIGTAQSEGAHTNVAGVALCVLAALSYAISLVIQKPLVGSLSALQVTGVACFIGALACLPFAPRLVSDVQAAPPSASAALVYLGVFPTAVAFTTYAYALRYVSASELGVSTYLVPPLAALISLVVLSEVPAAITWAGGLMCLAGVALTRRRSTA